MITINFTQDSSVWHGCFLRVDILGFPEVDNGRPLSPAEVIAKAPQILVDGKRIYTTSEHLILCAMKMVRDKKISPDKLRLVEHFPVIEYGKKVTALRDIPVDEEGCIDRSEVVSRGGPSGFFSERLALLR